MPEQSAEIDLSWVVDDTRVVIEAKSITSGNEVRQLRLGLGQVLDYAHLVSTAQHERVRAVLAIERRPSDTRWRDLCRMHDVELVWPDTFSTLFD